MYVHVVCLRCGKRYLVMLKCETDLQLIAGDFCGCCRKEMMEEFEKQFPKRRRIRVEE